VTNYIDTDGDGIPDASDSGSLTAQQLQSEYGNAASYVVETDLGTMKIGSTAFCVSAGARITQADIIANGGNACTAVTNGSDDGIKAVGVGGYYDFVISGLTVGATANIVIPLTTSIPINAVYRKYTPITGWGTFRTEGNDKLSSTSSTSAGVCPSSTSDAYTAGLTAGDDCLRITITDGGPNDADSVANGLIKDPGAVAELNSDTEANLSGGCSISGNPQNLSEHGEWLLLAAFIAWLGFAGYRRKQAE
jgi:hypothetical protein